MNDSKMKLYKDRFDHIREGQIIYSNGDSDPFVFTRKGLRWRRLYSRKHKARIKVTQTAAAKPLQAAAIHSFT